MIVTKQRHGDGTQHVITIVCDDYELHALTHLLDGIEPEDHTEVDVAHQLHRSLPVRHERARHRR